MTFVLDAAESALFASSLEYPSTALETFCGILINRPESQRGPRSVIDRLVHEICETTKFLRMVEDGKPSGSDVVMAAGQILSLRKQVQALLDQANTNRRIEMTEREWRHLSKEQHDSARFLEATTGLFIGYSGTSVR
ncbi:hypothetical protein ACYPKM_01430 [Pseudomonas aeruginosa]